MSHKFHNSIQRNNILYSRNKNTQFNRLRSSSTRASRTPCNRILYRFIKNTRQLYRFMMKCF